MTREGPADTVGEAIGRLFDDHAADVGRYLARRIGPERAEDLLSETFGVALDRWETYREGPGGRRAWLFGIATNLLRRQLRTEERQWRPWARIGGRADASAEQLDHGVAERVDADAAVRALTSRPALLSAGDREVLLLKAWADLSTAEIALALDIAEGTVRSRLHRARRHLCAGLVVSTATLSLLRRTCHDPAPPDRRRAGRPGRPGPIRDRPRPGRSRPTPSGRRRPPTDLCRGGDGRSECSRRRRSWLPAVAAGVATLAVLAGVVGLRPTTQDRVSVATGGSPSQPAMPSPTADPGVAVVLDRLSDSAPA